MKNPTPSKKVLKQIRGLWEQSNAFLLAVKRLKKYPDLFSPTEWHEFDKTCRDVAWLYQRADAVLKQYDPNDALDRYGD